MRIPLAVLFVSLSSSVLAADAGTSAAAEVPTATATAQLKNTHGKNLGTAELRQVAKGVIVELSLQGVPAGEHALHIHETGVCEGHFESAGKHFNPTSHQHGIANPQGPHAGDLPNLQVGKDGKVRQTIFVENVRLTPGDGNLLDTDGSALVIHAKKDDYASDPAGNAGDRIACGALVAK